jgi:DNA (cytosine-5)-methyltransferase 1
MRHLDLFSGYGGFTIPAHRLGWETIGFSEIDKYASAVLKFNFPNIENYGDITKIDFRQFNGEVDLITGGTPCQDLSVAGKGKGLDGSRSGLYFEFIRAITESNPKYFIWENVKGSLSSSQGWDMARVQIEMEQAGYDIQWVVYNAKDFGVPQSRERIFSIGTRAGSRREVLPEPTSTGQALKEFTSGMSQGYRVYDSNGLATAQASQAGGLGAKTGLYAIEARAVLTPDRVDKRQNGRRMKGSNEPSFTITGQDRHGVAIREATKKGYDQATLDGYRIRRFTPTECERLMGLPDGWTAKGIIDGEKVDISDTQRYEMCGNGVVTNVVETIYAFIN